MVRCNLSGLNGGNFLDLVLVSTARDGLREGSPMEDFRVADGGPGPASGSWYENPQRDPLAMDGLYTGGGLLVGTKRNETERNVQQWLGNTTGENPDAVAVPLFTDLV